LKILLDHNLDRRLKQFLTDYDTATTQEQGWADVLNGELLSLAEQNGFDVLLTADSNNQKPTEHLRSEICYLDFASIQQSSSNSRLDDRGNPSGAIANTTWRNSGDFS